MLTQRKKSTSALQLSRELGVKYDAAWRLKHKLMQVMLERVRQQFLAGRIEIDDAYLGGERAGTVAADFATRSLSSRLLRRRRTAGR